MSGSNRRIPGDTYSDATWERTEQDISIRALANQKESEIENNTAEGSDQQSKSYLICVLKIPVSSPYKLDVGDHVVFHRGGYDHHGIITDKKEGHLFEIAEASGSLKGKATLTCSWTTFGNSLTDISVAVYTRRVPKDLTAKRAERICKYTKEHPESYEYNLFTNNCEHFATYCATGEMYSLQVAEFSSSDFRSIFDSIFKSGQKENQKTYQCIPCENIKRKDDVKSFWDDIVSDLT